VRLREERIHQIAERIVDVLYDDEHLDYAAKLEVLQTRIERVIIEDMKFEDRIASEATERLKTYSREIVSGTAEWLILHEQAKEELAIKYNYYLR